MNDDFKRPLGSPANRPQTNIPVSMEDEDTLGPDRPGPIAPSEPPKKKRSFGLIIVSTLLVLALLAAGALGAMWYQEQQKVTDARNKLQLTEEALAAANEDDIDRAKDEEILNNLPSAEAFVTEFEQMQQGEANLNVDKEAAKAEIEKALKSHYKTDKLPEGWAVISIYQVAKKDEQPTGDLQAMVYLPADGDKPVEFAPLTKPKDGEWKYSLMRM